VLVQRLPGSAGEQCYRPKLARRGCADVGVKDLVIAEHRRVWVGAAAMVGNRPGRIEQAACERQCSGFGTSVDPHTRQRKASHPSQLQERRADHHLRRAHPRHVDRGRCQRQLPHHDQAGQPESAAYSKQERGSCGAGNKEEDHHVIQALQPPAPRIIPVAAVI